MLPLVTPPLSLVLAEVSDGIVALTIVALLVIAVVVAVTMAKGR